MSLAALELVRELWVRGECTIAEVCVIARSRGLELSRVDVAGAVLEHAGVAGVLARLDERLEQMRST
jgi:ribosomal protein S5